MSFGSRLGLLRLVAIVLAGRRYWLLAVLPLVWLLVQAGLLLIGIREGFSPREAQGALIGLPLTLVATFLGIRIIAGEIDGRSLEIAYTVPGGCERIWLSKLFVSWLLLIGAELLLVGPVWVFFTGPFPLSALYGALQAATFYLIVAMALAALFRSEAAGAMGTAVLLGFNGLISGFGGFQVRASPFWNPLAVGDATPGELLIWTLQNRVAFILVMAAILGLAFMRAARRERMLGA